MGGVVGAGGAVFDFWSGAQQIDASGNRIKTIDTCKEFRTRSATFGTLIRFGLATRIQALFTRDFLPKPSRIAKHLGFG